jgi:hypothetical protein
VKPWPKLFHNLRASRETELASEYPIHVVCNWIGNTAAIAAKHYWTVRDQDFERASQCGAKSGARAAQNRAQQPSARNVQGFAKETEVKADCGDMRAEAVACRDKQNYLLPPRGLEPLS